MKNLLSFVITTAFIALHLVITLFALFKLRSLEIQLSDRKKIMESITDPLEYASLRASYELTVREAERAAAQYNALLPAGRRRILHVPA